MILITGATGFLGRYLTEEFLRNGYQVRALVRNAKKAERLPAEIERAEGDLTDITSLPQALEGVEGIVHAGAAVSFQTKERAHLKTVNHFGTANLINAALESEVKRFLNVSSVSALGRERGSGIISEKNSWKPSPLNTFYGRTKYEAEKEVFRGAAEGLSCVQCLPVLILGAGTGDWEESSSKLFKQVAEGFPFVPAGINGWVGAEDVARCCRLLYESEFKDAERFIAVSENLSYETVFRMMAESVGRKPPSIRIPVEIGTAYGRLSELWAGLTGSKALVTRESARTSGAKIAYDGSLFRQTFNYTFEPVSETVRKTAQIYLSEKKKSV